MQLASRVDYGLRAMLDLALHYGAGRVPNQEISVRQGIPDQYLKQILPLFRRVGLVESSRGPSGGHRLARAPETVTVAEVIRALDGGVDILEIGGPRRRDTDSGESTRILADFWRELKLQMESVLNSTTLEDLCRKKRLHDQSFIYHI